MSVTFDTTLTGWRIADGVLKRGRGRDGDEQLDMIDGRLLRIGVHEGTGEDGTPYKQIECDLQSDEHGTCFVKSSIGLSPTASNVTATQFGMALLECAKGEWIAIKPQRSSKAHEKYGTYTTFVNIGIVDPSSRRAREVRPDSSQFPGDSFKEKLPHVLEALKTHPAYAPRPKRDEDTGDGFSLKAENEGLNNYRTALSERGWPSPDGPARAAHVELAGKVAKKSFDDFLDVPSDIWEQMAGSVKKAKECPPALKAFVDEHDPFADE